MNIERIGKTRDLVGESPFWDAQTGELYWVDIVGKAIRRLKADGSVQTWKTSDFPTAIALIEGQEDAVVSFASGLSRFEFDTGHISLVCAPEAENPHRRLNEGKCDPAGRFWAASMQNNLNPDASPREMTSSEGRLMRLSTDGTIHQFGEEDLGIPNTMAWSPDGSTFYFGDTLRNTIWEFDYDPDAGTVSNRRVLIEGGPGLPDGSGIDVDGCLWNARFGGGCLLRITPDGKVDRQIDLPCTNPTACTFGGDDLRSVFVTSGRFGLDRDAAAANPNEGALLRFEADVCGLPENYFREGKSAA